ncbi:MAG: hypothetical protein GY785_07995 [Gammaproteobacteria bacterium]|nr:hypothetical protein [Gammaproteobacteria bacterium]
MLFGHEDAAGAWRPVFLLWLFTLLFVARVGGQVLVAIKPRRWLPPMHLWNLIPYPILLPLQLIIIVIMLWINLVFGTNTGIAKFRNPDAGIMLIGFSAIYATVMVIRYIVRMNLRPEQRWFGGAIPIVFHFVLASYLLFLGVFYVGA